MIAAKPSSIPYLSALLPSELELQSLEETDSSEQDDQTDSENNANNIISVRELLYDLSCLCAVTIKHCPVHLDDAVMFNTSVFLTSSVCCEFQFRYQFYVYVGYSEILEMYSCDFCNMFICFP